MGDAGSSWYPPSSEDPPGYRPSGGPSTPVGYPTGGPYRQPGPPLPPAWDAPSAGGETGYLVPTAAAVATPRRAFGTGGAVLALVGGGMVAASFTVLDWIAGLDSTFPDLHRAVSHHAGLAYPKAYFGWLAWVALGVAVAVAWAACLPTPLHVVLRPLGVLVALAGIAATLFAVELLPGGTWHRLYAHTIVGLWAAVAGFGLAGLGALMGPRRVFRRR